MTKRASTQAVAVLTAIIAACSNSQPSADAANDDAAAQVVVQAAIDSFHQALRTNDPEAPLSWVADDVVLMPPGEPQVRGKPAMRTWYAAFVGQYQTASLTFDNGETVMGDDWATHAGTYEWTLTPAGGGANVVDRGNYMQVWRRQPDGRWLFAREIWNSTPSPQ